MFSGGSIRTRANAGAIVCVNPKSMLQFSVRRIQGRTPKVVGETEGSGRFAQPEARVARETDFFIWIRRNALKRPNSAKEIQGNASFFAWGALVGVTVSPPPISVCP
jgi:hypothetical protein